MIPIVCEVRADLDTPLSIHLKLAAGAFSYLFESVHGGEKWGRYSIIGLPSRTLLKKVYGKRVVLERDGAIVHDRGGPRTPPLAWIEGFQARIRACEQPEELRFAGGLVGYFGYDTIRHIEPRLARCPNPDLIGTPDILLMVSDEVVVFDNLSGSMYIIKHLDPTAGDTLEAGEARIRELVWRVARTTPRPARGLPREVRESDFVSGFTEDGYKQAVDRIKDYILAGDCMQVVFSQRLSIPFGASPLDLYRALRALNPSPYMYFLDLGWVPDRGLVTGDPDPAGCRCDHRAPHRRHPPPRPWRPRIGRWRRSSWPIPRNSPST